MPAKFKPKMRCRVNFAMTIVFSIFVTNLTIMSTIKISPSEWMVLKEKFKRKYNHLTDDDLLFHEGKEDELVERLAKRVRRNRDYILFTLKKGKADLDSNRL